MAPRKRLPGLAHFSAPGFLDAGALHRDKHVDDETYKAAVAKLGERGVVDLIGVSGYDTAVSMTLNVAEVPLPSGEKPPLAALKHSPFPAAPSPRLNSARRSAAVLRSPPA